ncbi:MAG: DUF975 family protein [Prevotellaceae bacterium]|jgi:uncharacterized membrane protein|nr:DUF975 family protein [Prevotellaceae bacterium]
MLTENKDLMAQARASLSGKWGIAVCTTLVFMLILATPAIPGAILFPVFGNVVVLIIGGPLSLGFIMFFLALSRGEEVKIEDIFKGFRYFGTALAAYLLVAVFTLLWMLLLIVPGIIASISYSQTLYILADNPELGAMEAINRSKKMMYGYKWKYFCLGLRFMGWILLCAILVGIVGGIAVALLPHGVGWTTVTCSTMLGFIGYLWLLPYMQTAFAKFYDDLKANQEGNSAF